MTSMKPKSLLAVATVTTAAMLTTLLTSVPKAEAAAVIDNGTIRLGVDTYGNLIVSEIGIQYMPNLPNFADGISAGCNCEGWGAADASTGLTGYANNYNPPGVAGTFGISGISFINTVSTATSVVSIGSMKVTHEFKPSASNFLYEVPVTIENTGTTDIADLRYRRVMDWDIPPNYFNEIVTIQGTAAASSVLFASDDGFASANPLAGPTQILFTGDGVASGPEDHGALFDFGFGSLAAGSTKTFTIFYGAAGNQTDALAALGTVGAEVYSLGLPDVDPAGGEPNTYIFGFKGVGGTPVSNADVPAPPMILGTLFAAIGGLLKRRKQKQSEPQIA